MLELNELSKKYCGKRAKPIEAINNLSLTIEPGEIFGFLGPNGAGKSTTIKILMGLIRPSNGTAKIAGIPATQTEARRSIGFLPENPAFYDFMTASEYLRLVGTSYGMTFSSIEEESQRVLRLLDLEEASNRAIRGYSKGMVQRLGLAQALLHDPDLYILDEPMSGLDPIGRALVKDIIKGLKARGKTVFFSTHITADVEMVCDRVGVIVKGTLQVVDSVERILRSGVEGYHVHLRFKGELPAFPAAIEIINATSGQTTVYVPKDLFSQLMEQVIGSEAEVDLIETRRKDIERFFLDIVRGN